MRAVSSSTSVGSSVGPVWQRVLRSLSALGSAHVVGLQLSRLLSSFGGLGGPDEWRSLPGQARRRSRRRDGGRGGAGLERLLAGEDVPGGDQDLARDGGLGGVALAVAVLGVGVEAMPGVRRPPGLLGGFDGRPAQRVRAGLGQPAGARALPGLLDRRSQAGVADELAGAGEARDVADLGGEREAEKLTDSGDRDE